MLVEIVRVDEPKALVVGVLDDVGQEGVVGRHGEPLQPGVGPFSHRPAAAAFTRSWTRTGPPGGSFSSHLCQMACVSGRSGRMQSTSQSMPTPRTTSGWAGRSSPN